MTTLRIEVGRYSGTTVEDVIKGLRQAGCMKHIEIYPEAFAHLPVEELRAALIGDGFCVSDVFEPPPPPLPWWRYARAYPRRIYYWLRRVFLRESIEDQIVRSMLAIYDRDGSLLNAISTRESPFMRKVRQSSAESFTLRGRGTRRDDEPPPS